MRALRGPNMAKLSKDHIYVFMKLIVALFPDLEVAVQVWPKLVKAWKDAAASALLLPMENDIFITKCVQFISWDKCMMETKAITSPELCGYCPSQAHRAQACCSVSASLWLLYPCDGPRVEGRAAVQHLP
uniref:Dynein heavy chain hydrolytic ATP-binding dynein motor region domain-containing protein n=1 Tax=Eutreptiella gymnastica TaxID=73025 RepID=A0A7S1IHZ0_9EUGL|mmetsp:Transcript_19799/g.35322  ORF Transcript_19799/g.35322 Transcript_19799/m.35322 type:complete len:130 (+) Transcript_19799:1491-1880(+)